MSYVYDVLQRVTAINQNGTQILSYGYDTYGRRASIGRAAGTGAATN